MGFMLVVAVIPVMGRIGLLEIFFLTFISSFFYEVSAELMWRWFVTDTGFGLRSVVFGCLVGIISSMILGKK